MHFSEKYFFWEVLFLRRSLFLFSVSIVLFNSLDLKVCYHSVLSCLRLFAQFPFIWLSDCSRVSVLNQDNGIENDTIIRKATSSCTNLWPNGGRAMQVVLKGPHSTHLESVRPFLANILFGKCLLADTLCTYLTSQTSSALVCHLVMRIGNAVQKNKLENGKPWPSYFWPQDQLDLAGSIYLVSSRTTPPPPFTQDVNVWGCTFSHDFQVVPSVSVLGANH